jgi:hypothetical protein
VKRKALLAALVLLLGAASAAGRGLHATPPDGWGQHAGAAMLILKIANGGF